MMVVESTEAQSFPLRNVFAADAYVVLSDDDAHCQFDLNPLDSHSLRGGGGGSGRHVVLCSDSRLEV